LPYQQAPPPVSWAVIRSGAMSLESNKDLVRRYQEILNAGNLEALGTVVAANISMPTSFPGFPPGLKGAMAIAAANIQMIPDFHVSIEELIAEGDRVAAFITITGTHTREMLGIPPTGEAWNIVRMSLFRIADDKIVEHRGVGDIFSLLQQIRALPAFVE
jgi:predicted ester cyclase